MTEEPLQALMRLLPTFSASVPVPGVVYFHADGAGRLLYVGSTDQYQHVGRQRGHARAARWWRYVARVEQEITPNRDEAFRVERTRIRDLRPVFNSWGLRLAAEQAAGEQAYVAAHTDVSLWPGTTPAERRHLTRLERCAQTDQMLTQLGVALRPSRLVIGRATRPTLDLGEMLAAELLEAVR